MPLKNKNKNKTRFANSRFSITKTLETSSREEQIKGACNKYVNIPCSKVRCSFYMHHTWLNNNLKQFSCAFGLRAGTVHVCTARASRESCDSHECWKWAVCWVPRFIQQYGLLNLCRVSVQTRYSLYSLRYGSQVYFSKCRYGGNLMTILVSEINASKHFFWVVVSPDIILCGWLSSKHHLIEGRGVALSPLKDVYQPK